MNPLNLNPNVNYLAQPRPVDVPEWRKGLAAFGDETAALGQGLLALGAQTVGATDTRDQALLDYQRNMDASVSGWQAPEVAQIEDIKLTEPGSAGRLGSYLGYQVPKGLAQLGSMVVSGLGAGAVARTVASKGIKELAKAEMKNLAADVAKKAVVTPLVEREAGKVAIQKLAERQLLGMQVGATAGIAGMEGGQMYGKLANDPTVGPDAAVLPTLAYTGIATALEYLPLHMAGKAIGLDRFLLRKVIKEDAGLAAKAAELSLKKKALGIVGKVAGGAAAGAATEGITEGLQSLAEQAATKYAQQDPQWASILPTTKEGWSDFWNSAAVGAAVGGVAGAALGPLTGAKRPAGEVNVPEAEAQTAPAGAGVPTSPQPPVGQAPAEAAPPAPGAAATEGVVQYSPGDTVLLRDPISGKDKEAILLKPSQYQGTFRDKPANWWDAQWVTPEPTTDGRPPVREVNAPERYLKLVKKAEVIPNAVPVPGRPEENPAAPGESAAAAPTPPTAERPQIQPAGGEVQAVAQPDGGWSVVAADGLIARDVPTEQEAVQIRDQEIADRAARGQVVKTTTSPQEAPQGQPTEAQQFDVQRRALIKSPQRTTAHTFTLIDGSTTKLADFDAYGDDGQIQLADGNFVSPSLIASITDPSGNTIYTKPVIQSEPSNAQQVPSTSTVYENVPRPGEQGSQEVQVSAEEGGQRVLPSGQEEKEVAATPLEKLESRAPSVPDTDSTGKLVHPTPEGRENFKKWFAGSKITNEKDQPLRVYHRGQFDEQNNPIPDIGDEGFHFGTKSAADERPVGKLVDDTIKGMTVEQEDGRWFWQFDDGTSSYDLDEEGFASESEAKADGESVAQSQAENYEWDEADYPLTEAWISIKNPKRVVDQVGDWTAAIRQAKAEGYDGIVYKNEFEDNGKDSYIAFSAEQIKSATGNRGTFEQGNPNILESRTSTPTQSTTDFVAQTDSVLGQGWTQRAIDAGILVVNETSPADSASGYFEPSTGKFVVNLDRTPERQSPVDVLLHEGSHASMARMLGGQFVSFHKDLERLAEQGSATAKLAILQATQGAIENINRQRARMGAEQFPHRIGDETLPVPERAAEIQRVRNLIEEQHPGLLAEEDLAYYIQRASASPPAEAGYWRRLLAAIQAWAAQTNFGKALATIGWRPELSPQLAVELAKQAAQATLRRAELVNTLVGERAKVLRSLPAAAQMGVMEAQWRTIPNTPEYEQARAISIQQQQTVQDWFLGKGPRPTAPTVIYRGVDKEQGLEAQGKYTHASPWFGMAERAGKFGGEADVFVVEIADATTRKYYRGGALAGDPLERTRINSLRGMTWDAVLDAAKQVYDKQVVKLRQQYGEDVTAEDLTAIKGQAALTAARDVYNATFETDVANKPGRWVGATPAPRMLRREYPGLRTNDEVAAWDKKWQTGKVLESRPSTIFASWWRSGVATAVSSAPQQKAAPQQWVGWLKNQPGVKQEEIDDLGLEDWLLAQEGSVQKADVEKFVRDGGVRIEEVVKQEAGPVTYRLERTNGQRFGETYRTLDEGLQAAEDYRLAHPDAHIGVAEIDAIGTDTKFATYQVPGGENYRELLITVPRKQEKLLQLISNDGEFIGKAYPDTQEGRSALEEYKVKYEAEAGTGDLVVDEQIRTSPGLSYTSSHWSEPNVLVHIRFNERTDVAGKRVLFVEEVQSDWGQEGRKKGFKSEKNQQQLQALDVEIEALRAKLPSWGPDRALLGNFEYSPDTIGGRTERRFAAAVQERRELLAIEPREAVPDMPLKSAWPLLGMKRAIRWAAEHGFDSVAWTPGSIQFDRYGSEAFTWTKIADGSWFLNGEEQQGGNAFEGMEDQLRNIAIQRGQPVNTKEQVHGVLETVIGRQRSDWGQAQWEAHLTKLTDRLWARMQVEESGMMLPRKEGMEGFYDRSVPNELKKYAKKFGAKMGETEIERGNSGRLYDWWFQQILQLPRNLANKANESLSAWKDAVDAGTPKPVVQIAREQNQPQEVIEALQEIRARVPDELFKRGQSVWSLPITPALREEALSGQLLYSLPFSGWELPKSLHTSPLSVYPEDFNTPGTFNKIFHGMVDRFNYVKDKSPDLYRAFDEWKNRQGAMQQEIQRMYLDPMRHWVSRYAPLAGDSDPIRRTELASGKITNKNQQYTTVEVVGHQLAARHILEDNVTEQLALKAAPDFLKELKKQLSPHNVGLLNAEIKLRTGGSIQISKLSNTDARQLFESYLANANPQSDIGQRWTLWNRRSAGYSIATPGTIEAQQDEIDGFINAHELYTKQVKDREIFQRIAELSDKLAVHQLSMLQEGDLLQQADVARLSHAYPHYVPLRREAFDYDRELAEMFDKPVANVGKLMTRDGSIASESASAVHVLQNHLAAGFAAASAAARNQMMNKFADVLYQDINGWKPWFYIKDEKVHKNDIGFIRGGKTLYIVPAEGNLRAASIIKVIAGKDAEQLSGPFTVMRHINNWVRWTNVSASPAFMLANTPRDYLTARYNLLATDAAAYAKEIGSMKNYKESYKALYKVLVQGVRETTDPQVQSWIDLVEDFEKSGGKTSFVEALKAMDGDSWKSFEAQVGRREGKKGAVVEWGRNKLEWLENLNIVLENVMRLSTYKVMRGKVGKERAAEIARNLTTNFTRKGAHIDAINTWWLFYNATVQGNWQVVQNLFFNPNKAGQRRLQKAVAGTVAFAFFIDQLGRAFSDDEDKDGISDWDSRPANDKERKISSPFKDPITGTYLSIPAPWVFNIFWRMGGMLGEVKDGVLKPQDALLDSVALTMNAMDPVGGFKALFGEGTPAQSISPTAFDPFMQIIENRDFRGNPLGPDGYPGASKRPDAYLTWDSTPQGFKTAAQFVNEVTGGSPVESGKMDFRPSSYKVLWDNIWGGVGRTGWDLAGLMGAPFSEEEFKGAEKLPLVKTFLTAPNDSTAISLYHDRAAQVLGAKRLEKLYSEGPEQNPQKLAEVQQARAAVLRMVPQIEDTERQIKALRKTLRSAQARGDSRTEEQLRERIVTLQKRFNSSYSRRVGN